MWGTSAPLLFLLAFLLPFTARTAADVEYAPVTKQQSTISNDSKAIAPYLYIKFSDDGLEEFQVNDYIQEYLLQLYLASLSNRVWVRQPISTHSRLHRQQSSQPFEAVLSAPSLHAGGLHTAYVEEWQRECVQRGEVVTVDVELPLERVQDDLDLAAHIIGLQHDVRCLEVRAWRLPWAFWRAGNLFKDYVDYTAKVVQHVRLAAEVTEAAAALMRVHGLQSHITARELHQAALKRRRLQRAAASRRMLADPAQQQQAQGYDAGDGAHVPAAPPAPDLVADPALLPAASAAASSASRLTWLLQSCLLPLSPSTPPLCTGPLVAPAAAVVAAVIGLPSPPAVPSPGVAAAAGGAPLPPAAAEYMSVYVAGAEWLSRCQALEETTTGQQRELAMQPVGWNRLDHAKPTTTTTTATASGAAAATNAAATATSQQQQQQQQQLMERCFPSVEYMAERIRAVRREVAPDIRTLYIATDGGIGPVEELASLLKDDFTHVLHRRFDAVHPERGATAAGSAEASAKLAALSGDDQLGLLVDMEVSTHASVFIGNAFSPTSSNICQLRGLRDGLPQAHTRHW